MNKTTAIGYNIVKTQSLDNLKIEKDGYINSFGKDCVNWFMKKMLEIESHLKKTFQKCKKEMNPKTIVDHDADSTSHAGSANNN